MKRPQKPEIFVSRVYDCSIEELWSLVATQKGLEEWLMPNDFQLRLNHQFNFRTDPKPGFDGIVHCEVLDFSAPKFLKFSWRGGPMRNPTTVEMHLSQTSEGVKFELFHYGFDKSFMNLVARFALKMGWKDLLKNKISRQIKSRPGAGAANLSKDM